MLVEPGDVERLAAIVALDDRDHLGRHPPLVHQPPDAQRALEAKRDLGLHVGQFLLEQLGLSQRLAELFAVQAILACGVPAGLRRAHHAPADTISRPIETAEGSFHRRPRSPTMFP